MDSGFRRNEGNEGGMRAMDSSRNEVDEAGPE